ncbi:hypothetical protein KIKIMORA_01170 [Brevundimonas phage vB_BpoS-Kikimora]|uniref:Uncharacterized protein n=1 Tax=Brevundimonas phage vB_BpoS-Kikimora TaxID=2948601 RepID=A0A9E7SK83_9CAUD|nr:hypothetical protein KIKIMORA_01170 [Brevundimonas phage vB_BpoS-Kikimora]
MILYPGLHRIQSLTCTPDEARSFLRDFLEEHPDRVDYLAQTFRGLSMKLIRDTDVTEKALHDWFRVIRAVEARVRENHPLLAKKLEMLTDLLHDRWLIWMRERRVVQESAG